jgi:mannosyltransferase
MALCGARAPDQAPALAAAQPPPSLDVAVQPDGCASESEGGAWALPLGALAVTALGFVLRFCGLGKESIWLDEVTSIIIARMDLPSVIAWAAGDIHPPLYYVTLHFWLRWGESEFAIRSLSATLGGLSILVLYGLAAELFGRRVGVVAALFLALSPLHIWYSQEARMYVMLTLWVLMSSYLMVLALRRQQRRYWLGYVVISALALYTHYFALFGLLFQNVYAAYWLWKNRRQAWQRWIWAQLAIILLFSPWLPTLYHQVTTGGGGWVERSIGQPTLYALFDTWLYFSIGLENQWYPALWRRVAYLVFALAVVSTVFHVSRLGRGGRAQSEGEGLRFCLLYLCLPVGMVWLLSQLKPMYSVRYLLAFLPPYCVLLAKGLVSLRWRAAAAVLILFLASTMLIGDWNAWHSDQNPDWRGLTFHVLEQAHMGDVVLFSPRWNAKPFEYYSQGRIDINMDLPIPVTPAAIETVINDISSRYQRVWLVWTSGHYSDPAGMVKQRLDQQYDLLTEQGFRGVDRLILYDLKAEGAQ